jgi:hypothetical protein
MFAAFSLYWTAVPLALAAEHGLSQSQIALFALVGAVGRWPRRWPGAWRMPGMDGRLRCWRWAGAAGPAAGPEHAGHERDRPGADRAAGLCGADEHGDRPARGLCARPRQPRAPQCAVHDQHLPGRAVGSALASGVYAHFGWTWRCWARRCRCWGWGLPWRGGFSTGGGDHPGQPQQAAQANGNASVRQGCQAAR